MSAVNYCAFFEFKVHFLRPSSCSPAKNVTKCSTHVAMMLATPLELDGAASVTAWRDFVCKSWGIDGCRVIVSNCIVLVFLVPCAGLVVDELVLCS